MAAEVAVQISCSLTSPPHFLDPVGNTQMTNHVNYQVVKVSPGGSLVGGGRRLSKLGFFFCSYHLRV